VVEARLLAPEAFGETPDALVIVTLPGGDRDSATANLRAPLVVDRANGRGIQLIGIDETWPVVHPFDLAALLR
jgi:flagellar assembly factor FliW